MLVQLGWAILSHFLPICSDNSAWPDPSIFYLCGSYPDQTKHSEILGFLSSLTPLSFFWSYSGGFLVAVGPIGLINPSRSQGGNRDRQLYSMPQHHHCIQIHIQIQIQIQIKIQIKKQKKTSYVVKYKPNLEDLAGPRTGRLLLKCFPKDLPDLHQCLHCPRENPSHCCEILSLYNKICHIFYVWANYVQSIDYVYADNSWQLVSFLTSELCLLIDVCHSTLCQIPVC